VTITGLDGGVPFEGDVLALKVPGLCPGGGVGGNDAVGHVLFMKKKNIEHAKHSALISYGDKFSYFMVTI
jgi:hypothetical protein